MEVLDFLNCYCPVILKQYYRQMIQEPAAEFLGTAILVGFGNAVNCQVALSTNPKISSVPKGVSIYFDPNRRCNDRPGINRTGRLFPSDGQLVSRTTSLQQLFPEDP